MPGVWDAVQRSWASSTGEPMEPREVQQAQGQSPDNLSW